MLAHDLCSRISQAYRVRHNRIVVHHTVQNLGILNILLRHGLISNITRGTDTGPDPLVWKSASQAYKRLWAALKYRDNRAVLGSMMAISKPSKRVFMTHEELLRFCSGRRVGITKPLEMGEIAVVHTTSISDPTSVSKDRQFLEAREALALGLGGEVLCRAG